MYPSRDRMVVFDADGTLVDAFPAVEKSFTVHGMDIGDLGRFQRRRKLLKYIGGLREFPRNLRRQFDKATRKRIKYTLTEVYREEALLFPGMGKLLSQLVATQGIRVGIVSRNVTIDPEQTLAIVLGRHGVDPGGLDFLRCIPLGDGKSPAFRALRDEFGINPLRALACGDEYKDYAAALAVGMPALVAAYGFEDHDRLADAYRIPVELIARTPEELAGRVRHALDIDRVSQCPAPS